VRTCRAVEDAPPGGAGVGVGAGAGGRRCERRALYGREAPEFCGAHRRPGDINRDAKRCAAQVFPLSATAGQAHCGAPRRPPRSQRLRHRQGCPRQPWYGAPEQVRHRPAAVFGRGCGGRGCGGRGALSGARARYRWPCVARARARTARSTAAGTGRLRGGGAARRQQVRPSRKPRRCQRSRRRRVAATRSRRQTGARGAGWRQQMRREEEET
jgi:hypothetical protein